MAPIPINLGVRSQPGKYSPIPLRINCEVFDEGSEAQFQYATYAKHGLADFSTLTNGGGIRGFLDLGNNAFVVSGQKIFSVDSSGNSTELAGVPGTDKVYMKANRRPDPQIVLVSNGLAYVLQNGVLSQYPDSDLPAPICVEFINGNFIFFLSDGRMFSSELESTDIDPLDFATAEADRDNCLGGIVRGDDLINFGTDTVEYWRPDGGSNFPFSRITTSPQGCMSGQSVAEYDGIVFWLDKRGVVRASQAYEGKDVSHNSVKRDIDSEPLKSEIKGFTYSHVGIGYYVISGTSWTWILNLETGFWHKAESYGLDKWRGLYSIQLNNETIIGDATTNKLYKTDSSTYTEGGQPLVWTVRAPLLHKYPSKIELNELYLNMVAGHGDGSINAVTADPKLMFKTSIDGGNIWTGERLQTMGQQGQRSAQIKFNRLGTSKEDGFAIEVSVSAAVAGGITGASGEVELIAP